MSISPAIPSIPHYAFQAPELLGTREKGMKVGEAVKDMPDGGNTSMKASYDKVFKEAEDRFNQAHDEYDKKYSAVALTANKAITELEGLKKKKLITVTLLVAAIILAIGAVLAGLITGMLPLCFIALPFLIGIAPSSFFIHSYNNKAPKLQASIDVPGKIPAPKKDVVAPYEPERDLELRSTRASVMNTLAQESLQELAQEKRWSPSEMVSYDLLDANKAEFYAKVLILIETYHKNKSEKQFHEEDTEAIFQTLLEQLNLWKSSEIAQVEKSEYDLKLLESTLVELENLKEYFSNHGSSETMSEAFLRSQRKSHVFTRKGELAVRKQLISLGEGTLAEKIKNWFQASMETLNHTYAQATQTLEKEYQNSRLAPA